MAENDSERMKPRWEAAALLLAGGDSVRDVALKTGFSERTISRWRRVPLFQRRVMAIRNELFGVGLGRLAKLTEDAVAVMGSLLNSGSERNQLAAAKAIVALGADMRKNFELEAMLNEMQERIEAIEKQRAKAR